MKYAMFIGRWQTWHSGHEWLINQQLNKGKKIWIAIRDVELDKGNPKTAKEVYDLLLSVEFIKNNLDNILITIIPDIESVNYGRGVGYDVIYHEPPEDILKISGSKIRSGEIDENGNSLNEK